MTLVDGVWRLDVDSRAIMDAPQTTTAAQVVAARQVILAAQLCIDLNRPRIAGSCEDAIMTEVLALAGDREISRRELAEAAGISYGRLSSMIAGTTHIPIDDFLRFACALSPDDSHGMLLHLGQIAGDAYREGDSR
ncbi:helix-turn-helix transcriptional regulator [Microbacterium sp. NEAU-LLC]|uniref:Helix-turn-helix transcriptional regulator n=1 Tax=Microbacterium helvum TaxID=2773713 RepID=A0ABR8NQ91_9MICO|nr:helix-turn-helix transcriptional regulator [Microbacterium helvum]MBD3942805.1 helix-turn-helix transcriptional regulator [Microbacterium helvum]